MRPVRVAAFVVALLLGWFAYQRLAGLDPRFLRIHSLSGVQGLAAYLIGDYGRAAAAYQRDLATWLADAEHRAPLATRALLVGDLDAAQRAASEALRAGRERDARLALGEVSLARGRYQEAITELDTLLATDVDQFDALLLKAIAQARLVRHGDAITSLNRALRHDQVETRPTAFLSALALTGELTSPPAAARSNCLLATLHRYLRIYDASRASVAVRYAERAVAAGDHPGDAHLTVGVVHLKHNRRARALASFRAAVAAEPRHPIALVRAANLHGLRGDLPEKDQFMTTAFEVAPEDHWVAEAFNVHLTELGDYQRAIDLNVQRTVAAPRDVKAWWRLSALYLELGEAEHSLAASARGLALAPRDVKLHENRAMALATAGQTDEAFKEYRDILARDPSNRRAHFGIALIHRDAKRYHDSRRSFETLLAMGQGDIDTYNGYCEILLLLKEGAAAEACASRVLRYDPDNVAAQTNLGVARRMQGRS
jgi:tetratricopeptide (TPR) repeat protein